MLRKVGIVLTVIALGMTAVGTEAFARGGGGGHRGGGFGAGAHIGGFAAGPRVSGGHRATPGWIGAGRGGFITRPSGLRSGRGALRNFQGDWGGCNMPYDYRYQNCGSFF